MDKEIKKIEKELLARHADDPIKLSKVHRYIRFLKIDLKCDADIDKDGTTIKIENGTQNFLKQHPAIATKLSISKEIEKLEDALGIKNDSNPTPSASSSTVDDKGRTSLI
ncbi:P27 family phage terminase small subunit [Lysinibacillus sp. 1P01SD]|uniref:P27 family phage terminase small subunit n=1 Tax=Lysinibacillus sp. 1P01SD TaxID=3132285 RepID=UPI00399F962E